jgi:hypothetical protein
MAHEKQYTAKQAAQAVLEKVGEILHKSELLKAEKLTKARVDNELVLSPPDKKIARAYRKLTSDPLADKKPGSNLGKAEKRYDDENSGEESAKPSEHNSKDADQHAEGKGPKGEIHPKEHAQGASDDVREQSDPQHNPKEEAEGNNELAGTTPTQVGRDGKNKPGGDEIKGHLKLAKFVGRMDYKRQTKKNQAAVTSQEHVGNSQASAEAQHKASLGE